MMKSSLLLHRVIFVRSCQNFSAWKAHRRIAIVGGGNVGAGLARQLEGRYSVKLIERNPERAEVLSEMLEETIVFLW